MIKCNALSASEDYVLAGLQPCHVLSWCNLKLAPVPRGQRETRERGWPVQVGKWQF